MKMKTEFQQRSRPKGILILVCLSVIIGIMLLFSNFLAIYTHHEKEKPIFGVKMGILPIFWFILVTFGIIYILLAVGFWRADSWALKLYNKANRAISITIIFYGALVYSNVNNTDPISPIMGQLCCPSIYICGQQLFAKCHCKIIL